MRIKTVLLSVLAVMMVICVGSVVSDDADGASKVTADVYAEIDGNTIVMTGTGDSVRELIENAAAASGYKIKFGPIDIISFQDQPAPEGKKWTIQQWLPPRGWTLLNMTMNPEADFSNGTSYCIHLSDRTIDEKGNATYSQPAYEPDLATAYFFIQFKEDVTANDYVNAIGDPDMRQEGFWIEGRGNMASSAFQDACDRYGLELNMGDGYKGNIFDADYIGWLNSFLGLSDENVGSGDWKYWCQFHSEGGKWVFSETLGHYDPNVVPYYAFLRQVTMEDEVIEDSGKYPSISTGSVPVNKMKNGCTVTFKDGDGMTVASEHVDYFGTATAPPTASKSPSGNIAYEFTGWDGNYRNVVSDCTVRAVFKEIKADIGVTGVEIDSFKTEMEVGKTFRFGAKVTPSNASNLAVTWESSNPSVATVDSDGDVTALSEGRTTITVKTVDGGKTSSKTLNVVKTVTPDSKDVPVTGVEISEFDDVLRVGKTMELSAKVFPSDATHKGVSWTSSDTGIVRVTSDGIAEGIAPGKAVLTVTTDDGGFKDTVEVEVMPKGAVTELSLSDSKSVMTVGESYTFIAIAGPEDADDKTVEWSSSDSDVLEVDADGNVTAKAVGEASVMVKACSGGLSVICKVRIVENLGDADSLDFSTGVPSDKIDIKLGTEHMSALVENGKTCEIKTDNGSILISTEVLDKYKDDDIDISFNKAGDKNLTDIQKDIVKGSQVYEFLINGSDVPDLGGKVTISVEYTVPSGKSADDVRIYHIGWKGDLEEMVSIYDAVSQTLTFETDHFSMYFASADDPMGGEDEQTVPDTPGDDSDGSDSKGSNTWAYAVAAAVLLIVVAAVFVIHTRKH